MKKLSVFIRVQKIGSPILNLANRNWQAGQQIARDKSRFANKKKNLSDADCHGLPRMKKLSVFVCVHPRPKNWFTDFEFGESQLASA